MALTWIFFNLQTFRSHCWNAVTSDEDLSNPSFRTEAAYPVSVSMLKSFCSPFPPLVSLSWELVSLVLSRSEVLHHMHVHLPTSPAKPEDGSRVGRPDVYLRFLVLWHIIWGNLFLYPLNTNSKIRKVTMFQLFYFSYIFLLTFTSEYPRHILCFWAITLSGNDCPDFFL